MRLRVRKNAGRKIAGRKNADEKMPDGKKNDDGIIRDMYTIRGPEINVG